MSSSSNGSAGVRWHSHDNEQDKDINSEDDEQQQGFSNNSNSNSDDEFDAEESEENSVYDNGNDKRGQVSLDSSPEVSAKKHYETSSRTHREAAIRERDREFQRKLYNENKGFPKSVDVANAIKRVMKEKVYPRLKILSDTESQFIAPDFVGKVVDQSRTICEILIRELDLPDTIEDKVRFWITYRSFVKNQLVKFRSNCVEELKREYFRGKWFTCKIHFCFLPS